MYLILISSISLVQTLRYIIGGSMLLIFLTGVLMLLGILSGVYVVKQTRLEFEGVVNKLAVNNKEVSEKLKKEIDAYKFDVSSNIVLLSLLIGLVVVNLYMPDNFIIYIVFHLSVSISYIVYTSNSTNKLNKYILSLVKLK